MGGGPYKCIHSYHLAIVSGIVAPPLRHPFALGRFVAGLDYVLIVVMEFGGRGRGRESWVHGISSVFLKASVQSL